MNHDDRQCEEDFRPKIRPLILDLAIAMTFFIAASVLGTHHVSNWSGPTFFYQEYFGAAVSEACGGGYRNVNQADSPALDRFLSMKSDFVACRDVRKAASSAPSTFQGMHRYLMGSAALVWRLRGVSWSALAPLFGMFFGATVALGFAIGRLTFGRALSSAIAAMLMFSSINLGVLPLFRDYSKAPFFLATFLLLGTLVRREWDWKRALLISAVSGLVVGIGLGFRSDLLVAVPAFLFCVPCFLPGDLKKTWKARFIMPFVFLIGFVISGLPILRAMKAGGASAHVSLLGFTSPFDSALGLTTPFYEWGYAYNDTHINGLLNMFSQWASGNTEPLQVDTAEYEKFGRDYIRLIIRHFPADMLTRACATVIRVLELPINGLPNHFYLDPNEHAIGIQNERLLSFYRRYHSLLMRWIGSGTVLCAFLTLLLLAARSIRLALCFAFLVFYFGSYAVLQFSLRHVFHLEIFGLWVVAFTLWSAGLLAGLRWNHELFDRWQLDWRRPLIVGTIFILAIPVTLFGARRFQTLHVQNLIARYISAPSERLPYTIESGSASDRVLLRPTGFGLDATNKTMRCDYIVVEIREDHPAALVLFRIRPISSSVWNTTRVVELPMPASLRRTYPTDTTRIFFPAYSGPEAVFEGVEIPSSILPSLLGIYRIDPASQLPMLLWLMLRPDWFERVPYQRLFGPELGHRALAFDDTDPKLLSEEADAIFTNDFASLGSLARVSGSAISIFGVVGATNNEFVHYRPKRAARGSAFIVKGSLSYGCIDVIVMKQSQFIPARVVQPGPFRVITGVPEDGDYTVVIANTGCFGPNDFTIDSVGLFANEDRAQ